jgi:DNA-binding transcriptional LysR family regulator
VPVDPPVPPRRLVAVWHEDRHRTPPAAAFLDMADATLATFRVGGPTVTRRGGVATTLVT